MDTVIVLGMGASKKHCDFVADEVWGINSVGDSFRDKKFHKMFAFDIWDTWYIDKMRKYAPVVSWQPYADIKYPLDEIVKEFNTDYFTNTITYMIAYAIYLGVSKIRMFGIDAPYGGQYHQDKSGVEYWIGRAAERGITVEIPEGSWVLKTVTGKMYGSEVSGNVDLLLSERTMLMNLLPRTGSYEDMVKANIAQLLFNPKDVEGEEYGITVRKTPDGFQSIQCKTDFYKSIHLDQNVWAYLSDILIKLTKEHKLPIGATSVYEKLVLSVNEGNKIDGKINNTGKHNTR